MAKKKLKRGDVIRWRSKGPHGEVVRRGIVRGFYPPGKELKFPKRADPAKFKAAMVNSVHSRYLVEIERVHARTGKKLPSAWMAPKSVALEKTARVIAG